MTESEDYGRLAGDPIPGLRRCRVELAPGTEVGEWYTTRLKYRKGDESKVTPLYNARSLTHAYIRAICKGRDDPYRVWYEFRCDWYTKANTSSHVKVLQTLHKYGAMTQAEIAGQLRADGLVSPEARARVLKPLSDLAALGFVEIIGNKPQTKGAAPVYALYDPNTPYNGRKGKLLLRELGLADDMPQQQ
jgi:hypothetical protein